jgi:hypothetical protein
MNLPSDIWRLIVSICRIKDITNLCSVDKSFYYLCSEKNVWYDKFKEKNLEIINSNIKNVYQYVDEYRKISYASYIANCLVNMISTKKYIIPYNIISFSPYFIIDDFIKIFIKDYLIFNEIAKYKNI